MKNKKNKYYCNNNIYPIQNNNCKNNSIISPLYEVENFLCNVNKLAKYMKFIKYFK